MAGTRMRRRETRTDYWPGFVDAMASLLLVIIFLLSVFVLAQFFLGQELSGRDTVLNRLNAQISELTELLALERASGRDLQDTIATLTANLNDAESERDRLQGLLSASSSEANRAGGTVAELEGQLHFSYTDEQRHKDHLEEVQWAEDRGLPAPDVPAWLKPKGHRSRWTAVREDPERACLTLEFAPHYIAITKGAYVKLTRGRKNIVLEVDDNPNPNPNRNPTWRWMR